MKPFRFGVQAFEASTASEWYEIVRKAEDLGYSTLFSSDHYFGPGEIAAATGHRPVDMAPRLRGLLPGSSCATTRRNLPKGTIYSASPEFCNGK